MLECTVKEFQERNFQVLALSVQTSEIIFVTLVHEFPFKFLKSNAIFIYNLIGLSNFDNRGVSKSTWLK